MTAGFDPFVWASGPDTDTRAAIAAEVVSRRPGLSTITKVKSHLDPCEASTTREQWLIAGNARADFWAERALATLANERPACDPRTEQQAIDDAFLNAPYLHGLSDRVFALRKTQTSEDVADVPPSQFQKLPDPRVFQNWSFQDMSSFSDPTWDSKFLFLLQHYFTLLKWPQGEREHDPGISLLEIMLDFCITFQARLPINVAINRLRSPGIPALPPKSPRRSMSFCPGLWQKPSRQIPSKVLCIPSLGNLTPCQIPGESGLLQCCTVCEDHATPPLWE